MKQQLYFVLTLLLVMGKLWSQENENVPLTREDSISAAIELDLAQYLPPLTVLIEVAIENSPDLDVANYETQRQEYELGITRKEWTDFVSVGGQYRYGGVSGGGGVDDSQALLFPEDLAVGAYAFMSVRIPLSYFVSRRDDIKSTEMMVKISESRGEAQKRIVEQEVVETYQRLLLLQRLIKISSEAKESSDLILEMSVERFRDGELSLDQLGTNTGLKAKYSTEYETLKSEFSVVYSRLERLIGMPISKLQNSQK